MKYKELYIEFANLLDNLGCVVCDHDYWGYCQQTNGIRAFIVIKPSMSYKERYMTLLHETGHLFSFGRECELIWSDIPKSEGEANAFALKVLKMNKIDLQEYNIFYERAGKAVKTRRLSWYEL